MKEPIAVIMDYRLEGFTAINDIFRLEEHF